LQGRDMRPAGTSLSEERFCTALLMDCRYILCLALHLKPSSCHSSRLFRSSILFVLIRSVFPAELLLVPTFSLAQPPGVRAYSGLVLLLPFL